MRKIWYIVFCVCALVSCREYTPSADPALRLVFSKDTLSFDTIFTAQGSATAQLMVYNRNKSALEIDHVTLSGTVFHINIDGESDPAQWRHMVINGGDSMYVFLRAEIDPTDRNTPVFITEQLRFHLANSTVQTVALEAYGQDVIRIGAKGGRTQFADYTFTAGKPYLLYDTVIVGGTLRFDAGATLYMHNDACLFALGDVYAKGTKEHPVVLRGDRLDMLFDSVPYAFAGGSWNGFYLQAEKPQTYVFEYTDILSANIGLYAYSSCVSALPSLRMDGCRIHNHSLYGLVLLHMDALVTNSEISNCASYCVYCEGGKHDFVHTTVASYFGYTTIRIQSTSKDNVAAVYIDNLSKSAPHTVTSFYNSIITGYLSNQIVVATPLDRYYPGSFVGNYLKTDTLQIPHAERNVYWQKPAKGEEDTTRVFVNDFYEYKKYVYYDFHLDSMSPAIGIGDSLVALPYPTDRDGVSRASIRPDAGCYQHQP